MNRGHAAMDVQVSVTRCSAFGIAVVCMNLLALTTLAHAAPTMVGEDTLETITDDLITSNCYRALNMFSSVPISGSNFGMYFAGGGAGLAGNAMVNNVDLASDGNRQHAGAQSRPLSKFTSDSECDRAGNPPTAQGLVFGLDAVVIVGDQSSMFSCGGGFTPHATTAVPANGGIAQNFADMPTVAANVAGTGWKDILRILYTGYNPDTGRAAGDCHPVLNPKRASVAGNYAALFAGGCSDSSICPGGIRHAYRLGDQSGTTDTFLRLIGAPAITHSGSTVIATPFCNGNDREDRDPIRRACTQDEQVCEFDGTLGLVLPIVVPTWTYEVAGLYNAANVPCVVEDIDTERRCSFAPLQSPDYYNHDPAPNGDVEPVGSFTDCRAPICAGPANPLPDPTGLLPVAGPDVVGYNLPTPGGVQQQFSLNSLRCDCRYPVPNDYSALGYPANHHFDWNVRLNGKCTGTRHVIGGDRFGVLNGDNGTSDNSPATWGNKFPRSENGVNRVRCCRTTSPPNAVAFTTEDPRLMNLFTHDPKKPGCECAGLNPPCSGNGPPPAFYRIHATTRGRTVVGTADAGTRLCQQDEVTPQISCLVQNPMTCNIAFSNRGSAFALQGDNPLGEAFSLGGVNPSTRNIQTLIDPTLTETVLGRYPLAHRVFYNTLIGFGNGSLTNPAGANPSSYAQTQFNLYKCFADVTSPRAEGRPAIVSALAEAGLVDVPALAAPLNYVGPKMCNDMCTTNHGCSTLSPVPAGDLQPAFVP